MTVSTTSIVRPRRVERRLGGRIFRSPAAVISLVWLVGLLARLADRLRSGCGTVRSSRI